MVATTGELPAITITLELPALDADGRVAHDVSWLKKILPDPRYHTAYALVVNTLGTTGLGFAYWAIAAHLYSPATVGRSSALVAALILLSSLTQFNLSSALQRFLPRAGRSAGKLIGWSYGVSSLAALPAAAVFVLVMPDLSRQWQFLAKSWLLPTLFVLAAFVWGIFALEDAALTGLQRAVVVPVENTAYGVLKLAALIVAAGMLPAVGIFVSWVVPLVAVIVVINALIFGRYLRRRAQAGSAVGFRVREVARFASTDYIASLFTQAYGSLLPLMVLSVLGAGANGSFYIAWTISAGPTLIAANFGTSLLVEASVAPHRLGELTKGVIIRCMSVTVVAAGVLIVAAGPILRIYGASYAAHAGELLMVLAIGAVPRAMVILTWSVDRVAGRTGRAAVTQAVLAVLVLVGSEYLLKDMGIVGVGYAWASANVIVGIGRMPTLVRAARGRTTTRTTAANEPRPTRSVGRAVGAHRAAKPGRHRLVAR